MVTVTRLLAAAVLSAVVFVSACPKNVLATSASPDFPSCNSASGDVVVNYADGGHLIPGEGENTLGSDIVYAQGNDNYLQCLCGTKGVQTNWWFTPELSTEEKNQLLADGWLDIPNGADWGLAQGQYLAKNSDYSCQSANTGDNSDTSDQNTNSSSCSDEDPGTPVLNRAIRASASSVTLSWTEPNGPIGYYVLAYGTAPGSYQYGSPNIGNKGTINYTVNNLTVGTKYYFVIRVVNGCKSGPFSNEASNELASSTSQSGQVAAADLTRDPGIGAQTLANTGNGLELVSLLIVGLLSATFGVFLKLRHA